MSGTNPSSEGLFPVSYIIGTGLAGAKTLVLNLLVYPPQNTVRGTAAIEQAVNPPLQVHSDIWGNYTYLTVVPPQNSRILITAEGNHGGPRANSPVNFKLHLVLEHDWKSGVANYSYMDNGIWYEVENVPAKLNTQLTSHVKGASLEANAASQQIPPIMVLYAAPIHGALASGDRVQMKALATLAKQQLDGQPQLRKELDSLKAEIAKLERK
ncbi:DUF1842 domain-containing protein [Chitinivorax sp. B]|uniref:DUF1842 domain-containing protein n=1 Tax=Chitinivorax sp. B TaxID=2502235 RepID=UPI0010F652D9|nr:DUF1842 domain-containing protein [Chitinivorax sp. B]